MSDLLVDPDGVGIVTIDTAAVSITAPEIVGFTASQTAGLCLLTSAATFIVVGFLVIITENNGIDPVAWVGDRFRSLTPSARKITRENREWQAQVDLATLTNTQALEAQQLDRDNEHLFEQIRKLDQELKEIGS